MYGKLKFVKTFLIAAVVVAGVQVAVAQDTTVTVGLAGEAVTLDPHQSPDRLSSIIATNIFDSLVARGDDLQLEPNLATSWEQIEPTVWRFELREGVEFHNGEPFNAESVKYTIDRFLDPELGAPMRGNVDTIVGAEIVDEYTVDIITEAPDVLIPARMSELYGVIVPPNYIEEVGTQGFADEPVGTGPWQFTEWVKNERLVLDAYDGYWNGRPEVDQLVLRPIPEASSRVGALIAGEVDLINNVPYHQVPSLRSNDQLDVMPAPTARVFFLVLDTTQPPFDDVRVRRAVNHAVNVEPIIEGLFMGVGTPVATIVIPDTFGYDPGIERYEYDPERARELLAEAGYPDGLDVEFDAFTGSIADHAALAEAVAGQLSEVGINAELNVEDFSVFAPRRVQNDTAPMYIYSYGNWALDASVIVTLLSQGTDGYYYTNDELDALIEEANAESDPERRAELLREVQQFLKDQAPYVPLFQYGTVYAKAPELDFTPRNDEIMRFYPLSIDE